MARWGRSRQPSAPRHSKSLLDSPSISPATASGSWLDSAQGRSVQSCQRCSRSQVGRGDGLGTLVACLQSWPLGGVRPLQGIHMCKLQLPNPPVHALQAAEVCGQQQSSSSSSSARGRRLLLQGSSPVRLARSIDQPPGCRHNALLCALACFDHWTVCNMHEQLSDKWRQTFELVVGRVAKRVWLQCAQQCAGTCRPCPSAGSGAGAQPRCCAHCGWLWGGL